MSDIEKRLQMAIARIEDMLMGDDAQAWKEAEKWLPYIKGDSSIPHVEDEIVYMCKVDFDHELGMAAGGTKTYASIEDLKESRPCVEGCGIVAVRVLYVKTIQEESDVGDVVTYPNKTT